MDFTRIESHIDAVTVYREGALVRRVADLTRQRDGYPEFVCVTNIPLAMRDPSVRVRVEAANGSARPVPVASDVRVTLDVPEPDETAKPPMDEELERVQSELRRLTARIAQSKRELARVERLAVTGRPHAKPDGDEPPPPSPTTARIGLLDMREELERGLRDELRELEHELYRTERHAQELEARHQRATSARQAHEHELRKALVIALHADADDQCADKARLIIEYLVPGARWAPAYTIRLAPDGSASFAMRAVVAQRTDEDWRAIELTLSTADAHSWTELPELSSIRIGRRQSAPPKAGWRPPPSGVEQLFADYDREFQQARGRRGGGELSQWDDQTREITSPGRRPASPVVQMAEHAVDMAYDDDMTSVDSFMHEPEEPTVPNLRPPPSPAMSMPPPPAKPMAGSMPMPSADAVPMQAKRRSKRSKERAEAAPADNRSRMAPMPPLEESAARSGMVPPMFGGMAPGGGYGEMAKQAADASVMPEPTITASTDLLAYGDLRMPSPRSSARGSLRRADRRAIYTELLISQHIEVSFNVLAVIGVATQRAELVAAQPLPARHRPAGSDRYDYAYTAETPIDVPSDGAFHSIALTTRSADTRIQHVVVPRESTDVFRTAELSNPLDAPILDGPVDVYLGKDFLLTSDVSFTPPGGTLRMGLGVEQAIKVTRNTSYREETSGLLRGSLLLMHELRVELENHLGQPVECEVRERLPTTRKDEDDIEVKVERVQPEWHVYKPELASSPESGLEGGYSWRVEVPGKGGRKTLTAHYSVKIPSKYELVGGNRREA